MFRICLLYRGALIINPCLARRPTNPCSKNTVKHPPVLIQSFPGHAPFPSTQLALALASSRLVLSVFKSALCSSKGAFVASVLLSKAPPPPPPPPIRPLSRLLRTTPASRRGTEAVTRNACRSFSTGCKSAKGPHSCSPCCRDDRFMEGQPGGEPGRRSRRTRRSSNPEGEALRALPSLNTDDRVFT